MNQEETVSKVSRRTGREEINQLRKAREKAEKALREKQKGEGLTIPKRPTTPNRKSGYRSVEEEQEAHQFAATEQARFFRAQLPILLKRLSKIKDPRNPKKIKHKLTALMIYGILMFQH